MKTDILRVGGQYVVIELSVVTLPSCFSFIELLFGFVRNIAEIIVPVTYQKLIPYARSLNVTLHI